MEESENKNKIKIIYKNNNFKFEKFLKPMEEYKDGFNDRFDAFKYNKDNIEYIISPGLNTYLIYIIRISDSQLFKSLKGHKECISVLNYFKNEKNNNEEYILSVDIEGILIIWDINNNFKIKHKINTKEYVIYSCIILFNVNNKENYFITSNSYVSRNENSSFSKIYSLANGKHLKNLKNTNNNNTYYILPWYDKKKDIYYLIECCLGKITIINILQNKIYHEFPSINNQEAYTCGFIYNKNEKNYLCSSSMHGEFKFWDLDNKKLEKRMICGKDYNLMTMIQWSEKYIIFSDNNINKSFKILDMDELKLISNIGGKHKTPIRCIKKINHSIFGNCIITSGADKSIIIWNLK